MLGSSSYPYMGMNVITWQFAGLVWQSEQEVTMVSQWLKRMQTCLKTVVIPFGNYWQSPEGAVVPKEGEVLAETILQADGCALPLKGDVAENFKNASFLHLALSIRGAGTSRRSGDAVGAGGLRSGVGESGAVEGEGGGLSRGPGNGLAGERVEADLLTELGGGDVGSHGGDEGGVPGGVGGEAGGDEG